MSAVLNFESEKPALTDNAVVSVTQISLTLKRFVENEFKSVRIRGEISGFKRHTSGHSYFSLKDEGAVLDAVAWRGTAFQIQPEDGLEVIITGRITTYPGRSKYQVVVETIEAAGKGALMALLLERKEKLQTRGLFDQKRPLPFFPQKIGIITSLTGAVIRDILHRLRDRFPTRVLLYPAQVQGPGSVEQICLGLRALNALPFKDRPDVIIIARGGGSLEDLWTFNEEAVVEAIAASQIPTISAIGHETDTTLADFAADQRAPTPTAAAELATPVANQLLSTIAYFQQQIHHAVHKHLRYEWTHLQGLGRGIVHPRMLFENAVQRLDDLNERLLRSIQHDLMKRIHQIERLVIKHPKQVLDQQTYQYHVLNNRFKQAALTFYDQQKTCLDHLSIRLEQADYSKILQKGFAYVTAGDQQVVKTAEDLKPHGDFSIQFVDGIARIFTKKIEIH